MCVYVQILFHFLEGTWTFSGFLFSAEVPQQGSSGNQGTTVLDFPDITTIKLNFKWIFSDAANQKLWTHVAANVSVYLGIKCFFLFGKTLCVFCNVVHYSTKIFQVYKILPTLYWVRYYSHIFQGYFHGLLQMWSPLSVLHHAEYLMTPSVCYCLPSVCQGTKNGMIILWSDFFQCLLLNVTNFQVCMYFKALLPCFKSTSFIKFLC